MRGMEKHYDFTKAEEKLSQFWEEHNCFMPKIDPDKKPFTILLPPPNASGKMHTGNVLMIAIEDLLIRWHRMKGFATLWVPGTDHAGTETQITFERELKKQGKSRLQYSREELYRAIWEFVTQNKSQIETQIRRMGASVDWSRSTFTLDPKVVATVQQTFKKMHADGLVYRGNHMVNYCPKCGTTYADVEIIHSERKDPLYYITYDFIDTKFGDFLTVATVRPEPIWADTHLAVNPKDKKHAKLIGAHVRNPLTNETMEIIADEFVDPKFGTGIVKLTPAVDKNDYEVAKKHGLPINEVLDLHGKLKGRYVGMSVAAARAKAIEELGSHVVKIDMEYTHTVAVCKAGHDIEPMILPNWFIAVDIPGKSLKKPAYDAVKNGDIKIFPKWREITYLRWMEEMHDWPVSRQNVWGIRIPVWYRIDTAKENIWVIWLDEANVMRQGYLSAFLHQGIPLAAIKKRLQKVVTKEQDAPPFVIAEADPTHGEDAYIPETDTFDTWFSSGQWPLVTLGYPDSTDFSYFYPTAVLETGWEIIRLWVSRMVMFGYYLTGQKPFETVYLHGMVRALDGRKMSKSLGNVINPEDYIREYGVDALRMGLISGTANGKDFAFPKDRVIAYKHFANKIWNMARFFLLMKEQLGLPIPEYSALKKQQMQAEDMALIKQVNKLIKTVDTSLANYRFADAAEAIYQFLWHEVADKYIESVKTREDKAVALSCLSQILTTCLTLLHPFMPFVTEEIYQHITTEKGILAKTAWPTKI